MRNGTRQHACNDMGLSTKEESSDEMIARGVFLEASAARIKEGEAAAMDDFISPSTALCSLET